MSRQGTASCFQLKGGNITTIVLELNDYPTPQFAEQLTTKVRQAPSLFQQSGVLISLEQFSPRALLVDFNALVKDCHKAGLKPMAFRGGDSQFQRAIEETGLPHFPAGNGRSRSLDVPKEPEKPTTRVETVVEEKLVYRDSMVIDKPIRGGQQVYAEGTDLIVLAQVSEGAEVLADGHIHIYAPLRGRALAGVKGNSQARIFCQRLEAELVSIAGTFMLSDELQQQAWKQPTNICLQGDQLKLSVPGNTHSWTSN
ncbi:septum site-determining protein MinC [bacterium SCSIO 12696]|nr:septum site-determining protein MinC [bacterium SCSIO 12696]